METIVVGDLHGDVATVNKALEFPGNVVFVGDYLDSFQHSVEDQITVLTTVLNAAEKEPERVTGLLGNHELSYIKEGMQCSGFKGATHAHVIHLENRMHKTLKTHTWVNKWLVTHAGLSNKMLYRGLTVEEYLEGGSYYDIGRSRGGPSLVGGIFWCDWWQDFEPVPGLNQVVGHSSFRPEAHFDKGIVSKGKGSSLSYNIDCLMNFKEVLLISEDGSATIKTL